jgi:DNA-binding response OmpR family regulator
MDGAQAPMRVILVDDDQSERETVGELVYEAGLEMELAATFEDVAQVTRDASARYLVLLGLRGDPTTGERFMRRLEQARELRARCTVVEIAEALRHSSLPPTPGVDRVVARPLNPQELVGLIRGYVGATTS